MRGLINELNLNQPQRRSVEEAQPKQPRITRITRIERRLPNLLSYPCPSVTSVVKTVARWSD